MTNEVCPQLFCKVKPIFSSSFFNFVSYCMIDLQRELWSLCSSVQVLLSVVGLQHHCIPLLGIPVRRHKVLEALWMINSSD